MRDAADDLTLDPLDPLRGVALARETPPPLDKAVTAAAPTTCKRRRDAADLDPVAAAAGAMLAAALFQGCGLPLPPVAKRAYTKTAPRRGLSFSYPHLTDGSGNSSWWSQVVSGKRAG